MKIKTRHGHYSDLFEEEARRIKTLYKDSLNMEITWTEATAIAAQRSLENFWNEKRLKDILARLRGIV